MGVYTEKYGGAMGLPRGKSDISDVSDISDSAAPLCYAAASLSAWRAAFCYYIEYYFLRDCNFSAKASSFRRHCSMASISCDAAPAAIILSNSFCNDASGDFFNRF